MQHTDIETKKTVPHNQQDDVEVTINGTEKEVQRGCYQVDELKILLGVPSDYELELIKNGTFHPLNDDEKIHIHGGEEFVSHVRCGAAS